MRMVFAVARSCLRQKRVLLSEEDLEKKWGVSCRVPPRPLPALEDRGGLCGQGPFLYTQYSATIRNVTYDGSFQHHPTVPVSNCAVLGAAELHTKKTPAQSYRGSPPLPLLSPVASPLTHRVIPTAGQSPRGSRGKEEKPRAGSCCKLWNDPAPTSCKPRALLVPLPRRHIAPSLHPQDLKS